MGKVKIEYFQISDPVSQEPMFIVEYGDQVYNVKIEEGLNKTLKEIIGEHLQLNHEEFELVPKRVS